ncbi:MAG: Aspartate--tRNA ligase [Firmicutes bacterium ADurb.Bin182]|nr:MAG: Aspartate--tRNA ligase [Firmicutes bacterium ADurb.Bin182]
MSELMSGWKRTCYCAEPSEKDVGSKLVLMGWVQSWRNLGALIFIGLRDRTGIMQLVFDQSKMPPEDFVRAAGVRSEYVLAVKGTLTNRKPDMVNRSMKTGAYEVLVEEFKVLSKSETPPIYIEDDLHVNELVRLKYRYLDLRRPVMQRILIIRHKIAQCTRDFFARNGFLEIETPMLTKSTPEGARDYLVPSRVHPGKFYALPQSPQLFKQLLMLSGFDRYMQIARCFRDEDLRADRQPDFTQIDLEMSFVDEEDVMGINEEFLRYLFKEILGVEVKLPLRRIEYKEAMERYGSDKPDTRFGMELADISDLVADCGFNVFAQAVRAGGSVRCICVQGGAEKFTRREIDALSDFVKTYGAKGLAWLNAKPEGNQSSFAKFISEELTAAIMERAGAVKGDSIFIVADSSDDVVFASLGALRLMLAEKLDLLDSSRYELLWVTHFPLFEWSAEDQRFVAKHHPFTSPRDEDLPLLETDPGKVRAKAYDIVLNGNEIGGGSIRIHSQELQERMFKALGFTREAAWNRFGFLLEAFKYGTPPHGGLAYGLDRLVMLLCGTDNIRDVIAFPKVQNASCPLTNAPSPVDEKQLRELHLMHEEK